MSASPYRDILSAAKWVQNNIELIPWDGSDFEKKFGERSAREIISSGKTSYLNPCLDQTIVFIHLAKEKGFFPRLIVEERVSQRTQQPTLHFAVEIPIQTNEKKRVLTVDFVSGRDVRYYEGTYDPQKSISGRTTLRVHRFSTRALLLDTTLNRLLKINGTKTLYKRFPHVSPRAAHAVFTMMQEMHSPKLYQRLTRGRPRMQRRR